jgi:uncharacterized membrane protein
LPKPWSSDATVSSLLFFGALAYFQLTLFYSFDLSDEGYLLFNIDRVAGGQIPHRDFTAAYGPGVYALTAPVYRIFGDRVLPLRELMALVRATNVVLAYLIARHFVPQAFALLAAVFATVLWGWFVWNLNSPYAALFTVPLCALALLLLLQAESREDRRAYVWAGFACGLGVLFKWSLAAVSAYGMFFAICSRAMLREPSVPGPRSHRAVALVAFAMAGSAIVLPFWSQLTPFDYLLHLAPIHALLAVVGFRFARFGDARSALARATPLLVLYGVGFLVPIGLVAALYLAWGSLGDLVYNMFSRPMSYQNYYQPIDPLPLDSTLLAACIAAWIAAALALVRTARRWAIVYAVLGIALVPFAYSAIRHHGNVTDSLEHLNLHLPAITAFGAVAMIAFELKRRRAGSLDPSLKALIAAVFFQQMMTFQIYPRGGFNVTLMLGTLAPVVAYFAYRCYLAATAGDAARISRRGIAAFILVALLPALFLWNKVDAAIAAPHRLKDSAISNLHVPALWGIRPNPVYFPGRGLAAFTALVRYLERLEPTDAPLLVVNNEPMIYFASKRQPIFEDHFLAFFLAGWDLLPADDPARPTSESIIERLEENPDGIIVFRVLDQTTKNFERQFPRVYEHIFDNYRVTGAIGHYRVMKRARVEEGRIDVE